MIFIDYLKIGLLGLVGGVVGALIGFLPIMYLHYFLSEALVSAYGGYNKVPTLLLLLVSGFPLPFAALFILPVGGGFFGIITGFVIPKQDSASVFLSAFLVGIVFNFFISFWAQ